MKISQCFDYEQAETTPGCIPMLHFAPYSAFSILALVACFLLVCVFEFVNGFHDTANAVATVIYTNSLKPKVAAVWSGLMNFVGVILGGISVAYGLVELLPADVLSPPNGDPAVPMLMALFGTLAWNLFTWWFGIPNSSSHCVIGGGRSATRCCTRARWGTASTGRRSGRCCGRWRSRPFWAWSAPGGSISS
ncbi:inorganic phosphate transporter [Gluconacetobacter azotocaptans DSM 13594]|nr:inorganic phosphate transporter [Gluconacetobacter azotocaptans]GBQ27189.1 inorganic phosphate transporter [Gluconacetobacter azotocaptans DSM 13594]